MILVGMLLASVPGIPMLYFGILMICLKAFVIICIIDVVSKTSLRRSAGNILAGMFLVGIVSFVSMYVFVTLS